MMKKKYLRPQIIYELVTMNSDVCSSLDCLCDYYEYTDSGCTGGVMESSPSVYKICNGTGGCGDGVEPGKLVDHYCA